LPLKKEDGGGALKNFKRLQKRWRGNSTWRNSQEFEESLKRGVLKKSFEEEFERV